MAAELSLEVVVMIEAFGIFAGPEFSDVLIYFGT